MQKNKNEITWEDALIYLRSFKNFGKQVIVFKINAFKKYYLLILASMLIAGLFGVYKYQHQRPFFVVKMGCNYMDMNKKSFGELIENLNTLMQNGSRKQAAKLLQMNEKDFENVCEINALNIAGSQLHEDITEDKAPFYIQAKIWDANITDTLQEKIITYLSDGIPQLKDKRKLFQTKIKQKIYFLENEISKSDSLISAMNNLLKGAKSQGNNNQINLPDMANLFRLRDSLMEEKLLLEWSATHDKPIELIFGFVCPTYPVFYSRPMLLLKWIMGGFFVGFLGAILLVILKKI